MSFAKRGGPQSDAGDGSDGLRPSPSVGQALAWASRQLRTATDQPRLEAELLLSHVLGWDRTRLLAYPEVALASDQAMTYTTSVQRRVGGEPLPYINGYIEFFGLRFNVSPDVLIPRPETELLVERALLWAQRLTSDKAETSTARVCRTHKDSQSAELLHHRTDASALRVVDVGTGSGCIAVSLAVKTPKFCLVATDISPAALQVARANAAHHSVAERIHFLAGDLLAPVKGPVDLIVSNPPYVAEDEWAVLPASVRREPRLALLAGPDGLDAIRRLLAQARNRLRAPGILLVEIGERQGDAVQALARAAFSDADVQVLPDLAGKARVLEVVRSD